jgi:hypothetical protein
MALPASSVPPNIKEYDPKMSKKSAFFLPPPKKQKLNLPKL